MFKKLGNYSIFQISYLLFFALLPFVYSEEFVDPALMSRQAFLSVFLLFNWSFLFIKRKQLGVFRVSNLSLLLIVCNLLLVILSFISILYANTISESIYVASKYGIIFLFLITTYILLSTKLLSRENLVNGILVFCSISLLYGICDVFLLVSNNLNVLSNSFFITATYANKNLFASLLLLCFWAIIAANIRPLLKYLLAFILITFTLLIQSKIVVFGMAFILLMLLLKNTKQFLKLGKTKLAITSVSILIILLIVILNFSKFVNLSDLHTLNTRYSLWLNSFKMLGEHPFGVGAGNWQIFFPKYGLSHFDILEVQNGMTQYQRPHNDFIWILCESGIQGLILYLSIFIIVMIMFVNLMRKENSKLPFILLLTVIAYCMVAFFDFPLERIEHQVLLSVVIAISMNYYDPVSKKYKFPDLFKYSPFYIFLISISLIVCYYRLKGEYFSRRFIALNKVQNAGLVLTNCNKARSFFYSIDATSTPIDAYKGIALFSQDKIDSAKLSLGIAYQYTPYNVHVLNNLGAVYKRQGDLVKANEYFGMAIKISPSATVSIFK